MSVFYVQSQSLKDAKMTITTLQKDYVLGPNMMFLNESD